MSRSPGEGSIVRRPDGRWCGALQVNGRRRYVYGATRAVVVRKLDRLKQGAVGGSLPDPGKRTVNDLLDGWLSHVGPTLKPRTVADYKAISARYLRPHLGSVRLSRLAPEHVQALYTRLQEMGNSRVPSHAHAVLHRACQVGVLWRWLPENPCDRVLKPAYAADRKEMWTPEDLRRFLEGTEGDWLHPLWVVAAATGCRLGELLAVKWDDLDWGMPAIAVRRNIQRIKGERVYSDPKTRAGERTITLPTEGVTALKKQRAQQAEWRLKAGPGWRESGLVFSTHAGGPMDHSTPEHAMQRQCQRLDLPKLTPHGLRHLAASLLLSKGLPITAVSARLGHASPNITMSIYAHAMKHQDRQAAAIMQEVMG